MPATTGLIESRSVYANGFASSSRRLFDVNSMRRSLAHGMGAQRMLTAVQQASSATVTAAARAR